MSDYQHPWSEATGNEWSNNTAYSFPTEGAAAGTHHWPYGTVSNSSATGAAATENHFWCYTCGKGFNKKYNCERHVHRVHESPEEVFPCVVKGCTAAHARKDHLKDHIRATHSRLDEGTMAAAMREIDNRYRNGGVYRTGMPQ